MDVLLEIRYLFRSLLRSRGYSAAAVITLALGVGANITLFLLVNAVFFQPLSYPHDQALVMLHSFPDSNEQKAKAYAVSYPDFLDWQQRGSSFEGMAAYNIAAADLSDGDVPENVAGAVASPNFFSVLGVKPAAGGGFDNAHLGEPVVLLGNELWQRRYHGDKSIIGKNVSLSGRPYTVIGIMPAGFEHPEPFQDRQAEFWVPLPANVSRLPRSTRMFRVIARLKPSVSPKESQAEMTRVGAQMQREFSQFDNGFTVQVVSLREQLFGEFRRPLLLLLSGAGIVLLIACINVTNLQLARSISKGRDILIRNALGAVPGRIVLWAWGESCVLALMGAALGLLLAAAASRLLLVFNKEFALFRHASIDTSVVLFTIAVVVIVGFLTSVIPAFRVLSLKLSALASLNTRGQNSGPAWRRLRGMLVGAQLSLVLPLLIISVLLGRSFYKLAHVDPGFSSDNLLTFRLILPPKRYSETVQKQRFYADLIQQLRSVPGIRSAGLSSGLPLTTVNTQLSRALRLESENELSQGGSAFYRVVDEYYFDTMRIPLINGRTFAFSDGLGGLHVAVVNESFAKTYWYGENPIGKRVRVESLQSFDGWLTIVGVVGNVHYDDLTQPPAPDLYVPFNEDPWNEMAVVVRVETSAAAIVSPVRSIVQQRDSLLAVSNVQSMEEILFHATARSRFALLAVTLSSSLAFILALVGVGAVVTYVIADRTHEFSIRMALGAQSRDITRLVLGYGAKLAGFGMVTGIGATFIIVPLFSHFVYGVQGTDVLSFVIGSTLLLGSVLVACYLPGRRTRSIDPASSLRIE